MQHKSDLELAQRVLRRDESAEQEFMRRMRCIPRIVAGFGRHYGANLKAQDIEELQQEVVHCVIRGLRKYRGDSSLETWVYSICRSAVIRYLRDRDKQAFCLRVADPLEGLGSLPSDDPEAAFERHMVHLSTRQATICRMRYVHEYTFEEISSELGISVPTAKKHSQRATETLREILGTDDADSAGVGAG